MRVRSFFAAFIVAASLTSASVFAQNNASGLSASLSNEEKLLSTPSKISQGDVDRLQKLINEIQAAKDEQLLSRAQLMLVLFDESLRTKARSEELDQSIRDEARSIRRQAWHQTEAKIVKTGFWIGLTSLGLVGVSQAVKGWTADQFAQKTTIAEATPYFIAGRISEITTIAGTLGALGGLGTAWALSVNPFDIPAPQTVTSPVSYPHGSMSVAEKITFLEGARTDYQKKQQHAAGVRRFSVVSLAVGLTGAVATGVAGYLGNVAYNKYSASTTAADATTYRNTVTLYEYITIGTASLALLGLSGATVGYLFGPDPAQLERSVQVLDSQIKMLQEQQ